MSKISLNSEVFIRGVADIITKEELESLLGNKKTLRIKHGIDATGPDLHIGHAANLWKLRKLQEIGHKAVIVLGDFTTRIGDPTGKTKSRPKLEEEQIEKNISSIKLQIEQILLTDPSVYEVRRNSEWWESTNSKNFLQILSLITHARLIERDMFQERIKKGEEISVSEFLYPILQGYDSVAIKSDVTIIGSDQIFNEHLGRFLQEKFGQKAQVIIALELLPGLDGKQKMSKSANNFIGLLDSPRDKFGKTMKVVDGLIIPYLQSYTDVTMEDIADLQEKLNKNLNPKGAKLFLAEKLVERYHGKKTAQEEKENFESVFSKRELPEDIKVIKLSVTKCNPVELLVHLKLADSKSEAKRLLGQGAVEIDEKVLSLDDKEVDLGSGSVIKVGKRNFVRVEMTT
ncbi:MAG: tyrosine--tRNA ligase [bacterium]|nr:tyrosine--tRNA ligase [bacterium]